MKHVFNSLILFFILILNAGGLTAQYREITKIYKQIDTVSLGLTIYYPDNEAPENGFPVVVFFFGGGWNQGTPDQFKPHSIFLTENHLAGITVEYRVKNRHNTSPQDAITDAVSAIRWIKKNAGELGLDPEKIIAAGGSAGGHLAAATATLKSYNDPGDDMSYDPVPSALILFNPVLEITKFTERFGGDKEAYNASPIYFVTSETPQTLIFHGTNDKIVPFESILDFQKKMSYSGNYCEVILFGGYGHAFFNKGKNEDIPYNRTLILMKAFLTEQGFIHDQF